MESHNNKALQIFRKIALAEGISFLVLLFIAMPLRKFAGIPEAVKIVGWLHGVLFIAFIISLAYVAWRLRWSFVKIVLAFIASLIPFGTFLLDRNLKHEVID